MTSMYLQKSRTCFSPWNKEDLLEFANYKENQVVEFKLKTLGAKKLRSLKQLRMYWGLIRTVLHNLTTFMTEVQMSEYIKLKLGYIESVLYIEGKQYMKTGSLSLDNMNHTKFCAFFDKAKPFMADMLGITEDELLENYENEKIKKQYIETRNK